VDSLAVRFKASALRELEALDDRHLRHIVPRIEALAWNPRPAGCKKLTGASDLWRIRIGDYRVVYSVDDGRSEVEILRVRHRRDVYA
jgi:mRNA interferase RelE/StbE